MTDRLEFPDGSVYTVVRRPADPEREALAMEFLLQPNCPAPPPQSHPGGPRETFEVVEGAFELMHGNDWKRLEAGESLTVAEGEVHTFRNHEAVPARVRNVHDPAHSFERYIRRIHALATEHGFERVSPKAAVYMAMLMREHSDTIEPAPRLRLPMAAMAALGRALRLRLPA